MKISLQRIRQMAYTVFSVIFCLCFKVDEMFNKLAQMIKGLSIMIFLEGVPFEDGRIKRFFKGAFYLVDKLRLNIAPVYIDELCWVLPKKLDTSSRTDNIEKNALLYSKNGYKDKVQLP